MKKQIKDLDKVKDLFYKYIELLEIYRDMWGKDTQDIARAKHNCLQLETTCIFNLLSSQVLEPNKKPIFTVLNNIVSTLGDNNVLQVEKELVEQCEHSK